MSAKTCGEIFSSEDFSLLLLVPKSGGPSAAVKVTAAVLKMEMLPCFDLSELLVSVSTLTKYFAITKHFLLSEDCKWDVWLRKKTHDVNLGANLEVVL